MKTDRRPRSRDYRGPQSHYPAKIARPILIGRPWCVHVLPTIAETTIKSWASDVTYAIDGPPLLTCVWWWSGGPESTRSTRLSWRNRIRRPPRCHVSWNLRMRREHSPTGNKISEYASIKGGAPLRKCITAPINLLGPTNLWTHHLPARRPSAPRRRPHVYTWPRVAPPHVCVVPGQLCVPYANIKHFLPFF